MFGYVRIYEDEMKVKALKLYRAVYCGLCKTAEKRCGWFSKLFLSYDYTFFAVARMIFTSCDPVLTKKRCGFKLFAKKDVVSENESLLLSARIFSVLTYYKLLDNVRDDGFIKSLGSRLLLPIAALMRRRALKCGSREVDLIVSDCMERISLLEKRESISLFEISSVFGDMMGSLLSMGLSGEAKENAYTVGHAVGCYIYTADAADDLESDEKSGSFNPLILEYKSAEKAKNALCDIKNVLLLPTDEAADILSEMKESLSSDGKTLCEAALNILYLGCPSVTDGILCREKSKKVKNKKEKQIKDGKIKE